MQPPATSPIVLQCRLTLHFLFSVLFHTSKAIPIVSLCSNSFKLFQKPATTSQYRHTGAQFPNLSRSPRYSPPAKSPCLPTCFVNKVWAHSHTHLYIHDLGLLSSCLGSHSSPDCSLPCYRSLLIPALHNPLCLTPCSHPVSPSLLCYIS